MDSITQAVLGASVGEVVLGKKVGKKAPLWGMIGGTLPDLDVLLNPFLSDVESLVMHRTFSHSVIVLTLLTPLIAYLVYAYYKKGNQKSGKPFGPYIGWCWLFFLVFITHILLDAFTNYGTMLLYPFSDHRFAWDTIFVIDPVYTIPLFTGTLVVFIAKNPVRKRFWNKAGLVLSTAYLLFTCFNKIYVNNVIEKTLASQNINYESFITVPTPFNNVLWSVIVKSGNGFYTGYYSLLDDGKRVNFLFFPQNREFLEKFSRNKEKAADEIRKLVKFSKGYYVIEPLKQGFVFNDIRFGTISGWFERKYDFIFSFGLHPTPEGWVVKQEELKKSPSYADFQRLMSRMLGEKKG